MIWGSIVIDVTCIRCRLTPTKKHLPLKLRQKTEKATARESHCSSLLARFFCRCWYKWNPGRLDHQCCQEFYKDRTRCADMLKKELAKIVMPLPHSRRPTATDCENGHCMVIHMCAPLTPTRNASRCAMRWSGVLKIKKTQRRTWPCAHELPFRLAA